MMIVGALMAAAMGMILFLGRNEEIEESLVKSSFERIFLQGAAYLYRTINCDGNKIIAIYKKISKKKGVFQKEQVLVDLHTLEPVKSLDDIARQYYLKKISYVIMIFLGGGVLLVCIGVSEYMNSSIVEGAYIERYAQGNGERYLTLEAKIGEEQKEELELTVEEQKYSDTELEQFAKKLVPELESIILGENSSPDVVNKNLCFVNHVEGYPFLLKYEVERMDYIDEKGRLLDAPEGETNLDAIETWNKALREGIVTTITVTMQYEEYQKTYSFSIRVIEKEKTKQEVLAFKLKYLLQKAEFESRTKDRLLLPTNLEGESIQWGEQKSKTSLLFFTMLLFAVSALYVLKDNELHKEVLKRETQMMIDYPEIVSKITLLTGAGLTVRNCFYRIAKEYQNRRVQGYEKHYAYEEILLAVYEMESGISEVQAYENYGKRCRLQQYIKLSALLVQNLKKSSAGIFAALREEATESFDIRKSMAKKSGEEAGTKMLVPMVFMLGVVMVIIFYPAMASFAS